MLNRVLSWVKPALFLVALASLNAVNAQTIYYVNAATGDDINPGTSWGAPYRNLTKALAQANVSTAAAVEIWVAAGTYTPIDGLSTVLVDTRDTSFTFYRGDGVGRSLKVYGGFTGGETAPGQRDTLHPSYLDGDLGGGNSYHVGVIAGQSALSDSIVIDGFRIRNGGAAGLGSKIFNSAFIDRYSGGGLTIYANPDDNKILIRNCRMENNWAAYVYASSSYSVFGHGAGMLVRASNVVLERCRFTNNTINGLGGSGGAAMYIAYGNVTLKSVDVTGNQVTGGGGSVNVEGGALWVLNSTLNILNSSFLSNRSKGGFGSGSANGGAIRTENSVCNFTNTTFTNNVAIGGDGGSTVTSGLSYGGAIYNQTTNLTLTSCTFTNDTSACGNNVYVNNLSQALGGAIYTESYPGDSLLTVVNSTFSGNVAIGGGSNYVRGGAICMNTKAKITGSHFNNNFCSANGYYGTAEAGAIFSGDRVLTINRTIFTGNASLGGMAANGGAITAQRTELAIDSCRFDSNNTRRGGAICIQDNYLKLTNSTFTANTAIYGGCLYFTILSPVGLTYTPHNFAGNNTFSANVADSAGGAMYMDMTVGGMDTMANNLFVGNKTAVANTDGGALCLSSSTHFIVNNTFYKDSAMRDGGAIKTIGSAGVYKMANNIFYGNIGGTATQDTCLRSLGGFYGSFSNSYSGADPLFINALDPVGADAIWATADDGLRLQNCSPAINTGNTSLVSFLTTSDLLGNMRVSGSAVDKGAYENILTQAVTGPDSMCVGSTVTFTDATTGGTWGTSNAAVATVTATGSVTALSAGLARIRYIVNHGCLTDTAYRIVTVQSGAPAIGAATDHVCYGNIITLTNSVAGGVWSIGGTAALVSATGVVTGIAAGTSVVTYTIFNACGYTSATIPIYVETNSVSISGTDTVCVGGVTSLSVPITGGTWSVVSGSGAATIDASGHLTGLQQGAELVQYTGTNSCGPISAYYTVNVQRTADQIVAPSAVCTGSSISLSDSTTGGTWTTGSTSVITVTGASATGIAVGTGIVTYSVTNACGTTSDTMLITVQQPAGAISGAGSICVGGSASLTDAVAGGTWSVAPATVASINAAGVITGLLQGNVIVTYSLLNACGTTSSGFNVGVNAPAAAIAGTDSVCPGSVVALTDATTGGTWSSSNTTIATVSGGTVGGVNSGTATITYAVTNACGSTSATLVVTVLSSPSCNTGLGQVTPGNTVQIYPNPATDAVRIDCSYAISARLYNVDGRIVRTLSGAGVMNINELPDGLYLLEVLNAANERVAIERIVKASK
ncbi:hypothetical protein CJD36_011190 [Flavipsychrobacter stenotrophus]|uniref:Secretion system C-terminal sorting domain-containing protein n=1 Tax=Flavipsychrobacter stenotrophus TaxID=2077091 RepID=A0A2S7SUD1_9BACT|nr:choice-of-anchor Q domain-containing protein [Flavipsychrobacter stenotrophus]PQJ10532.1 hypothetical protein CJD36_011190 [Flavipsychrobacter stenotrophus]